MKYIQVSKTALLINMFHNKQQNTIPELFTFPTQLHTGKLKLTQAARFLFFFLPSCYEQREQFSQHNQEALHCNQQKVSSAQDEF